MATNTNHKTYVVDSSVILSYLMVDEQIKTEHEQIMSDHVHHLTTLCAPLILPFEIGNGLRSAILSKRLSPLHASQLYKEFLGLEIKLLPVNYLTTLTAAHSHNLSYYDSSYLALATKLKSPLLTHDKKLLSLAT